MPTVVELQRLEALLDQLVPLATIQRGNLIRAQDWNTVVGALIELSRALLATDSARVVPPHDHPDQVTTGWLDPRLRNLLQQGPLADPAGVARVNELDRKMERLTGRLEQFGGDIGAVRERVNDVSTRDLTRQSDLTAVNRVVQGMADSREDVRSLRETLGSVQADLLQALEASQKLTINGQPADLNALNERLVGVEELRDRLRTPAGDIFDATALEMRLTELTNTLVTQAQLDDALKNRTVQLDDNQASQLKEAVTADLRNQFEMAGERLAEDIRSSVSGQLAGIDQAVSRAVADALPELKKNILAEARLEISVAVEEGNKELEAIFNLRLDETATSLGQDFSAKITDLQNSLPASIASEVKSGVSAAIRPLRSDLAQMLLRVDAAEVLLKRHDDLILEIDKRTLLATQDFSAKLEEILGQQEELIAKAVDTSTRDVVTTLTENILQDRLAQFTKTMDRNFSRLQTTTEELINKRITERLGPP